MKKRSNEKTVLLGLSGGVDSSVAAILLKKQGYTVLGAFMKNFSDTKDPLTGQCSYLEDKKMAQKVALKLGIKFIPIDSEREYKEQVIKPMFDLYSKGKTPNPDIPCNTIIKFPILWKYAKKYNADFIATGHYAQIKKTKSGFSLLQGKDKNKDQTYFLSELTQKDLEHTLFPIGLLEKEDVRNIAKKHKLPNWNKKGTRGICFVGKIDMKSFLKRRIKGKPGKIKSPEGKIIGTHPGSIYFTLGERIGPRKDIEISKDYLNQTKSKLYISKKQGNTIFIASENHPSLKTTEVKLKKLHLINPKNSLPKNNLKIRIRHLGELHSGRLTKKQGKNIFITKKKIENPAPGQKAVIYKAKELIASAEIT